MTAATVEAPKKRQRGQTQPGAVGKHGEEAVLRYLKQKHGNDVIDVRLVPLYQKRDIDFLLPDDTAVEVKTDTWLHKTGNLFFEAARDHGFAGCFYRSKADVWAYVDAESGKAYLFRLSEAQAWLSLNFQPDWLTTTRSHRKGAFVTFVGWKVPLATFVAGVQTTTIDLGQ